MRVTFCQPLAVCTNPIGTKTSFKAGACKEKNNSFACDFCLSAGVGITAGLISAGILSKKKVPNAFINALGLGIVFSYITYIATLLSAPFRLK